MAVIAALYIKAQRANFKNVCAYDESFLSPPSYPVRRAKALVSFPGRITHTKGAVSQSVNALACEYSLRSTVHNQAALAASWRLPGRVSRENKPPPTFGDELGPALNQQAN